MKFTLYTFVFIATSLLFASCSNELEIIDEYKDIPVVYGLLNRNDTTHLVRLEKGFLGEGNALLFAQNPDSIYYDTAVVVVKVFERKTNGSIDTLICFPKYDIIKNEGLFTDEDHIVYQLNRFIRNNDGSITYDSSFTLINDATYSLEITNKLTGKITRGSTKIVNSLFQLTLFPSTKINLASTFPFNVKISSATNGKIYGLIMRIKYKEINNSNGYVFSKYIDYYLSNQVSRTAIGGEELIFLLNGDPIMNFIGRNISPNSSVRRPVTYLTSDFIFTVGSEDFYNFVQINAPGNTVNYIPDFTTLSNGKGIFSSRLIQTVADIKFNSPTQDSLLNGRYTAGLFN
jgi:hypothetical protein